MELAAADAARTDSATLRVIACGVRDPCNMGSIMRLLGCFGVPRLLHVGSPKQTAFTARAGPTAAGGLWARPEVLTKLAKVARGMEREFLPIAACSSVEYARHLQRPAAGWLLVLVQSSHRRSRTVLHPGDL